MRLATFILFLGLAAARAATPADAAWERIITLDAGPSAAPKTAEEARATSLKHLAEQEKALRFFAIDHRDDARIFEVKLRLARLLTLRSRMTGIEEPAEIENTLNELEKIAKPGEQRMELDFARLARRMRQTQSTRPTKAERAALLEGVRKFQSAHPADRRVGGLIAEVSTLFDAEPGTKRTLIAEAQRLVSEPELKAQLADDSRRLSLLGKPLALRFTGLDGRRFDTAANEGRVVLLHFFAAASPPARASFAELRKVLKNDPGVVWAAVSLDTDKSLLTEFLEAEKIAIPVAFDGKSWESPLLAGLGINALPTAWLLDREGKLASLDGFEDTAEQIARLKK